MISILPACCPVAIVLYKRLQVMSSARQNKLRLVSGCLSALRGESTLYDVRVTDTRPSTRTSP